MNSIKKKLIQSNNLTYYYFVLLPSSCCFFFPGWSIKIMCINSHAHLRFKRSGNRTFKATTKTAQKKKKKNFEREEVGSSVYPAWIWASVSQFIYAVSYHTRTSLILKRTCRDCGNSFILANEPHDLPFDGRKIGKLKQAEYDRHTEHRHKSELKR